VTVVGKFLVGLVALFFLVWGVRFIFTPEAMAAAFSIVPNGEAGLATVRGDLGGAFVAIGAFAALGLWQRDAHWLWAAMAVIGAIAIGRIVGFAFDGFEPMTVVPFVVELVFIAVLLFGVRRLGVNA
jgi:Domain of unknown function (DUF4345)